MTEDSRQERFEVSGPDTDKLRRAVEDLRGIDLSKMDFRVTSPDYVREEDSMRDAMRRYKDTLPDLVLPVSGHFMTDKDFVIANLEKQVVGFQRLVAWLLMEQGRLTVEIPYSVILDLPDTAELVMWKNSMTEGQVVELRGAPEGYDWDD